MDPDGYLYVVGRMANAERFKVFCDVVYAQPIEKAMAHMQGIKDIIVVGVPNGTCGDDLAYCVT